MTEPSVEQIAKELSKAQRYWVCEGSAHGDCSMRIVRALIGKGLWHIKIDSPDGRHGAVVNTTLGDADRTLLATAKDSK